MSRTKHIKLFIVALVLAVLVILPFIPLIFTSISFNFRWPDAFPKHFTMRDFGCSP